MGYKGWMTTTPSDSASSDDRDEHDSSDATGIDDSQLPEDLQPSKNPLAAGPTEDSGASDAGGEPPD